MVRGCEQIYKGKGRAEETPEASCSWRLEETTGEDRKEPVPKEHAVIIILGAETVRQSLDNADCRQPRATVTGYCLI